MRPEDTFDFRSPDYTAVIAARIARLERIRANPTLLPGLFAHYRDHPEEFITDWGVTYDPRNVERGQPATVPFILFPRQREWITWVMERWRAREPGVTEKTRDMGMSWCSVALACTLCLFHDGLSIGFGSRKENYVDKLGDPKSLFWKARMFMENLPSEFTGGWTRDHAPHMRIKFPRTGSTITGEAGDNIGRGDRASLFFVDEAAFLERPQLIEASLSATTNCRIDISTPNGRANPFADKRFRYPPERVFSFHWRSHPARDDAWYAKQMEELDPVTVAQEIDINYAASVEGVLIPAEWVNAAVNADEKLGLKMTGRKRGALDVADEGKDMLAYAVAHGVKVAGVVEWSGKGSDIFGSVQRAFQESDEAEVTQFRYDADGLGAGVRGDARVINESRPDRKIRVEAWRGSAGVALPEKPIPSAVKTDRRDRTNKDYFANAKAQGWWDLRVRFQRTYRAVNGEGTYPADDLISIPNDPKLITELSQPTYSVSTAGKIVVDKAPDGTRSPNKADAVMILMAPGQRSGYDLAAAL